MGAVAHHGDLMLADGHRQKTVATSLNYSPATIKGHLHAITRKIGARNSTHAVAMAVRAGDLS